MMEDEDSEQSPTSAEDDAAYERTVRTEWAVRKARVVGLEEQISRIDFELLQLRPEKLLLKGIARDVAQNEVYRKALQAKQVKLLAQRTEALEDFERAEERLRLLKE